MRPPTTAVNPRFAGIRDHLPWWMPGSKKVRPKRICIYGSKSNPPHVAHKKFAETLLDYYDEVWFFPDGQPAWKDPADVALFEDRFDMSTATFEDNPRIKVFDTNKNLPFPTRTINLMREVFENFDTWRKRTGTRIALAVGADALRDFGETPDSKGWTDAGILAKNLEFVVAPRDGIKVQRTVKINGKRVRLKIKKIKFAPIDLSSSDIIKKLRAGQSIKGLVVDKVEQIIKNRRLFQKTAKKSATGPPKFAGKHA